MHKHILIATDGSDLATKAVESGLDLARQIGARVTILTASEDWSVLDMAQRAREGASNPIEDYEALARANAEAILARCSDMAQTAGVVSDVVYARESHPAEAIVENAKSRGCDLIVMASHGRRGIDRLLLGSQTSRVLALTNLPVLIYR
ncbi:MAG: UspA protein [Hyphomicrobiales bacterium]|nr:UspA protein [Hyphomicrobiales bacterium]